ncbi:MAG: MarR family winged helix-turn-helix transcriptional regulator [Acidimicrobiia bacterium]
MQETLDDELTEALLTASRALVGCAARSVSGLAADVTLPQLRLLVMLSTHGTRNLAQLAVALDVQPSTATRMCDRLVAKGLVDRQTSADSRREIDLSLTSEGKALVRAVMRRRRREIARLVAAMDRSHVDTLIKGLREFAAAAGESSVVTGDFLP